MRFLSDQDVYASTIVLLRHLGHDVALAATLGLAQATDSDLLTIARDQARILITRDRDFGGLVFVEGRGPGVVYLRILPSTRSAVHVELERVLITHTEDELHRSFVVIEPGRYRIRKLPSGES